MNNGNSRGILEYEDDLLAALEEARAVEVDGLYDEPESITLPEARKVLDLSRNKTMVLLSHLCDTGKLRRDMIRRVNAWGYMNKVPGYKLIRNE